MIKGVGISARSLHFKDLLKNPLFNDSANSSCFTHSKNSIHFTNNSNNPNNFNSPNNSDNFYNLDNDNSDNSDNSIEWIELVSDNYLNSSRSNLTLIEALREKYPLALHSVNLSIGSTDPFNKEYLKKLKRLKKRLKPSFISDHLCWTSKGHHYFHDLLPLPYREDIAKYLVQRIQFLQDFFEDFIALENISSYFSYKMSSMSEADFIKMILEESKCKLLLDLNNLYVNRKNNVHYKNNTKEANNNESYFDDFLKKIPKTSIQQVHLAGFTSKGSYFIDTHAKPVAKDVWTLFEKTLKHYGALFPTCIEWDQNIPSLKILMKEVKKARLIYNKVKNLKRKQSKKHIQKEQKTDSHP